MLWIESVRSRAYHTPKTSSQHHGEDACAQCEWNALNVGEDVGVESPGDADHDDRQPVDEWDVAVEAQLPSQNRDKHDRENQGRSESVRRPESC